MSDTPKTDEEMMDGWSGDAYAVSVKFAQNLERENESLKAQLAECRDKALEEAATICDQTPSCRPCVLKDIRSLKGENHDPATVFD